MIVDIVDRPVADLTFIVTAPSPAYLRVWMTFDQCLMFLL